MLHGCPSLKQDSDAVGRIGDAALNRGRRLLEKAKLFLPNRNTTACSIVIVKYINTISSWKHSSQKLKTKAEAELCILDSARVVSARVFANDYKNSL